MELADCHQVLQILRDLVATIAALIGIIVAVRGLEAWRRQLRANTGLEVARRLLRAAYQTQDAIKRVRNPIIDLREIEATTKEWAERTNEPHDEVRKRSDRPVYSARWKKMDEPLSELRAAVLEAKILWGELASEAVRDLEAATRDLLKALEGFLSYSDMRRREPGEEALRETLRQVVQRQGKSDDFEERLEAAVNRIEAFVRPKISLGLK